jgi:hypothetical protein
MDRSLQELVWSKLPLNEFQRQDLLNNLVQDLEMDRNAEDNKSTLQHTPPKKRKKRELSEQSGSQDHMC